MKTHTCTVSSFTVALCRGVVPGAKARVKSGKDCCWLACFA